MPNGRKQQQIDIYSNWYFSKSKQNSDFFSFLMTMEQLIKLFKGLWPKRQEMYWW